MVPDLSTMDRKWRRRPASIMMMRSGRTTQSRMEESRRMFCDCVPDGVANDPGNDPDPGRDSIVIVADAVIGNGLLMDCGCRYSIGV